MPTIARQGKAWNQQDTKDGCKNDLSEVHITLRWFDALQNTCQTALENNKNDPS